jgi:hypothetical protein
MAKHSPYERAQRDAENERIKQIQASWYAAIPADTAKAFERDVAAARARGPLAPPPDQAPGTMPNPPRPGREPRPAKSERPRGRS